MAFKINEYITIKDASEEFGVTQNTLRNWERDKRITVYRNPINKYSLYKKADIKSLLNNIEVKPIEKDSGMLKKRNKNVQYLPYGYYPDLISLKDAMLKTTYRNPQTLSTLAEKGLINLPIKKGRRVFYKKSDIEVISKLNVMTPKNIAKLNLVQKYKDLLNSQPQENSQTMIEEILPDEKMVTYNGKIMKIEDAIKDLMNRTQSNEFLRQMIDNNRDKFQSLELKSNQISSLITSLKHSIQELEIKVNKNFDKYQETEKSTHAIKLDMITLINSLKKFSDTFPKEFDQVKNDINLQSSRIRDCLSELSRNNNQIGSLILGKTEYQENQKLEMQLLWNKIKELESKNNTIKSKTYYSRFKDTIQNINSNVIYFIKKNLNYFLIVINILSIALVIYLKN